MASAPAVTRTSGRWRVAGVAGPDATAPGSFELAVVDGVITSLTPARASGPDEPWLVVVPLLVNAHDHGRGTGHVLAGIPDAPLEPWIETLRALSPVSQDELVGDGCALMLAAGVGASVICVNPQRPDVAAEVVAAARAVERLGVRAAVVFPFADAMDDLDGRRRDAPGWSADEIAARLATVDAIAAEHDSALIEVQLGPVGLQWVSEATLAAIGEHARRTRRRVHMHLLESRAQRAWTDRTYPEGIVELLRRMDLLGPQMCFAHGTQLRPDELRGLAAAGCVLSLNASSNMRLCSGFPPLTEATAAAVEVGAGLDGLALGDDADYWTELRLLRGIGQAQSGRTVDAAALLDRLVRGGRQALGASAPQPVATGNVADFVVVDLTPYRHLAEGAGWSLADIAVAAGRPERIREVWVGGRALLDRAPVTADRTPAADDRQPIVTGGAS